MRNVLMAEDEILVSFDAVFLFTNVPTSEAIEAIRHVGPSDAYANVSSPE